MSLDVQIAGTSLDSFGQPIGNATLDPAKAGYVILAGEVSETGDPAGRLAQGVRTSTQGRLTVGQQLVCLNEAFNNTTLNSAVFTAPVTTQTVTCASGTLNLNASAITTLSTVSRVSTYAMFPIMADSALYAVWDMSWSNVPQTNCVTEAGLFQCSASTAPTDGAFFRFDTTGTLKAVLNTNGSELTSAALTVPSVAVMHRFKIVIENDRVLYYIDGACQAVIATPNNMGLPTYQPSQPFTVRTYNGGVAPTLASTIKLGYIWVAMQDSGALGKDNATIAAIQGRMGSQGQTGQTAGTTALYSNSLAAGAGAVMTNTTAALGSGLGGQFSALPTLAAGTDGIVSSYQNPLPTAAIPGKTLYIKGVRISSVVTTVLVGNATPVVFLYSLAYGHTAVSMATAEAAATKAPRRVPLGAESFAAAAAVGTLGSPNGVYMPFLAPIAVNPGEFVAICAKNVGVVTTTGVVTFLITFDAYFE